MLLQAASTGFLTVGGLMKTVVHGLQRQWNNLDKKLYVVGTARDGKRAWKHILPKKSAALSSCTRTAALLLIHNHAKTA